MKALLVHCSRCKEYNGSYYGAIVNYEYLKERYLSVFDELTICMRETKLTKVDDFRLKKIEGPNISYSCIDSKKIRTPLDYRFNKEVYRHICSEIDKCDCVIARVPSPISIVAVNYCRKIGKPFFLEVIGCAWDVYRNHGLTGKIAAPFMWAYTRAHVKAAPYAAYVTDKFLQRRYPCKGKTMTCSDVQFDNDDTILEKRIEKIENMNGIITLGTIGAVNVRYKGQQYVIKAISELKKEGYKLKYQIVGGGDNSYLKSVAEKYKVSEDVEFTGDLTHDKIFGFLDGIDAYIQPSLTEGLPRALIEAMSRACPVAGTKVGGIPEIVNADFLFKKRNVKNICSILKRINKKIMKTEAKRSFERARDFLPETLDKKRTNFYKEFVLEEQK